MYLTAVWSINLQLSKEVNNSCTHSLPEDAGLQTSWWASRGEHWLMMPVHKKSPAPGPPSPGTGCFHSADALKKAPREWDPKLRTLEGFFFFPSFFCILHICTEAGRREIKTADAETKTKARQNARELNFRKEWKVNLQTLSASLTRGLCKYRLVEILGPREPKSWAGTWRRRDTTPYSAGISIQVPYTLRI